MKKVKVKDGRKTLKQVLYMLIGENSLRLGRELVTLGSVSVPCIEFLGIQSERGYVEGVLKR